MLTFNFLNRKRAKQRANKKRSTALALECLESRALLSATPFSIPGAHPAPQDDNPFVQFKGSQFFAGSDTGGDVELWRTDGKTASRVANINPTGNSNPAFLTVVKDDLYFAATNGANGVELFKYDGKSVSMVADIKPGAGSSSPYELTAVDKTLYFVADDGTKGFEVWRTGGSSINTIGLTNINTTGDSNAYDLTPFNDAVYFGATPDGGATYKLYKTGGIPNDAVQIVGILDRPYDLTVFKDAMYFGATSVATGQELWRTTGTTASLVSDINSGAASSGPYELTVVKDNLYFGANDGINGVELWKTNEMGSVSIVANVNAGGGNADPYNLTASGDALYFFASNGTGNRLWRTNGNSQETVDIAPVANNAFYMIAVGSSLNFIGDDNLGVSQVWTIKGTSAPTKLTSFTTTNISNNFLTRFKGKLVFTTDNGSTVEMQIVKKK